VETLLLYYSTGLDRTRDPSSSKSQSKSTPWPPFFVQRRFIGRTCHLAMFGMVRALPKANRGIGLAARSFAAKGAGTPMLPAVSVSPYALFPEGVGAQVPPRPRRASIGRIR
jgi:hypothetical protein